MTVQFKQLDCPKFAKQLISDFRQQLQSVRGDCISALEAYARALEPVEFDDPEAIHAAILLGKLRANDEQSLRALCKNLSLHTMIARAPSPLNTYVAAESLVEIGGDEVVAAIIFNLQRDLTHDELLLSAHILYLVDGRDSAVERLLTADTEPRGKTFPTNSQQVRHWLTRKDFPQGQKYRPGFPPGPVPAKLASTGTD